MDRVKEEGFRNGTGRCEEQEEHLRFLVDEAERNGNPGTEIGIKKKEKPLLV